MAELMLNIVLIARESTSLRLRRTLNSALQQTYEPKTVWVINAKPSDNAFTLGLLEDLKPYPEVNLLSIAGEGTEFYYRNKALERVGGDFVAFMSDIDLWEPDKATRQIKRLMSNPRAGATFCNALILRETPHGIVGNAEFDQPTGNAQEWMLQKTISYGSQVMYRSDALQLIGKFDERLAMYGDLDALVRMTDMREVLFTGEMPVKVHIPPGQTLQKQEYADNRYLLQKHIDFFLTYKRTAFDFCLLLARQSLENYEWLLMIGYVLRALLKQPLRMLLLLLRKTARALGRLVWHGVQGLYIMNGTRRLHAALRWGKAVRPPKPARELKSAKHKKEAALDQLREYEFVRFANMKFMRNNTLEYVKIPDYVTVIPRGMFYGCTRLHTVEIPATVTRIEANAFQDCKRLKNVRFAYGSILESIGAYAFACCVSLTEIELSSRLMALGDGAFAGCANLNAVRFASLRTEEEGATTIGFPSGLRMIPQYAFAGCSALSKVSFEPGSMLEVIQKGAFYRCANLGTIRITGTVQTIGPLAFSGCVQLMFLDMQAIDSIRRIGKGAFENCRSMHNLYIPHSIKTIYPYTFRGCASLKRVKIPAGIKRIGRRAFAGCRELESVILMDETTFYRRSSFPRKTKVAYYQPLEDEQAGRSV